MDHTNINDLKANPKNPRTISKEDYKNLVQSIKRFGDLSGIVFNLTTQQLVGGHMRTKAMREVGGEAAITYTQRFDQPNSVGTVAIGYVVIGDEKYPYREVQWDLAFEQAANIAANRITGQFDLDLLAEINYEISQNEQAADLLRLTGQTEDEINKLLDQAGALGETIEDEVPEVSADPAVSELGKIYQLGKHRVMCGDSTDKANVELLMGDVEPDGVHTDPPYGLGKKMSGGTWATKSPHYKDMHEWDLEAEQAFFDTAISQGCDAIIWGGNYFATPPSRGWIIWKKPNFPTMADCEIAFTTKDMNARVLESNRSDPNKLHPTQKPIEVTAWALSFLDGKNILDLFLGSGSTLIACEQTDRICYGMELDPKYVDVIRKRYAKFCYPDTWQERWQELTPEVGAASEPQQPDNTPGDIADLGLKPATEIAQPEQRPEPQPIPRI